MFSIIQLSFCIKLNYYGNFHKFIRSVATLHPSISSLKIIIRMKTINLHRGKFAALLVVGFTMLSLSSFGQDKTKSMTVSGEVLDMACYMSKGAHGDSHKDCAAMCIKGGSPMGVLTSDGKVYLLIENHDKADAYAEAKKHAGEQVTVTGNYYERSGMQGLVVNEVKGKM